jgi:hypothetical protein
MSIETEDYPTLPSHATWEHCADQRELAPWRLKHNHPTLSKPVRIVAEACANAAQRAQEANSPLGGLHLFST